MACPIPFHSLGNLSDEDRHQAIIQMIDNFNVSGTEDEDGECSPRKQMRLMSSADSGVICSNDSASLEYPRKSGIVLEVVLENFLSHSYMAVPFNKDINFITGKNGSGKSAILTAIVVALGGNAFSTGRGVALKDFIKYGSSMARVTCVISNNGKHWSHKKEIYGGKIIIERILMVDGGSRIKIKSCSGKIISTKMEELKAITLKLGIQINNPISVLDQNSARHFLNQSTPEVKFEFYMKATALQSLTDLMNEVDGDLRKITLELTRKEKELIENNLEVNEAEKKFDMIQKLEDDKKTLLILKTELLWAQVRDCKNSLECSKKQLQVVVQKKEEFQKCGKEITFQQYSDKIESSKKSIETLNVQKKSIEHITKSLTVKFKSLKQAEKDMNNEITQIKVTIEECEKFIVDYKSEIKSQEEKKLPEYGKTRANQVEDLSLMENNVEIIRENYKAKKRDLEDLNKKADDCKKNLKQITMVKTSNERELEKLKRLHVQYKNSKSSLSVFGPCMEQLVRAINNCCEFKEKPLGPLGSFIELTDSKWALAVENAIGKMAYAFAVTNSEDEKLLKNIIKKINWYGGPRVPIRRLNICSRPIDTSQTSARTSEYCNILDIIKFRNGRARNVIIEYCNLDTSLLIPSDDECYKLLSKPGSVPRNCRRAFTLNGDIYIAAPSYGSYYNPNNSVRYLNSCENIICQIRIGIQEKEKSLKETETKWSACIDESRIITDLITDCDAEAKRMFREYNELRAKVLNLKDELSSDINTIALLREEVSEKEKYLNEITAKMDKLQIELEVELPKKIREVHEEDKKQQQQLKEINCQIGNLRGQQTAWAVARKEIELEILDDKRRYEALLKDKEDLTSKIDDFAARLCKITDDAEKLEHYVQMVEKVDNFVSKINTDRPVEMVDYELRCITRKKESFEKAIGSSIELIETDYHRKILAFNTIKNDLKCLKINADFVKKALEIRKTIFYTVTNITSAVVSHQFGRILQSQNFTGKVTISFKQKTLHIDVHPIDEGQLTGRGTLSLSGGERSFATVSFIIALWNVTDLPFYFLDECDVFMDDVNRPLITQLLLKYANIKLGHQFGFITPHGIPTGVCASERLTIYRLQDPIR